MEKLVNWLASQMINNQLVDKSEYEWLRYGLEKRILTLVSLIPFVLLASYHTNVVVAVSFFIGFCTVRRRTNGVHANSFAACFAWSLVLEYIAFVHFYRILTGWLICVFTVVSWGCIFLIAPYNHPNMHLSETEVTACRKSSRISASMIAGGTAISMLFGAVRIAKGLALGMTFAAILLCLAYFKFGGSKNEEKQGKSCG